MPNRVPTSLSECNHFTDQQVRDLLKKNAVAASNVEFESLKSRLNSAAMMFAINRNGNVPPPSDRVASFDEIQVAANRLLTALSAPDGTLKDVPAFLIAFGGLETLARPRRGALLSLASFPLADTIKGIHELKLAAGTARAWHQGMQHQAADPNRHSSNAARKKFMKALIEIWEHEFRRDDVKSKAFRTFVVEATTVVGFASKPLTDKAIQHRLKRLLSEPEPDEEPEEDYPDPT